MQQAQAALQQCASTLCKLHGLPASLQSLLTMRKLEMPCSGPWHAQLTSYLLRPPSLEPSSAQTAAARFHQRMCRQASLSEMSWRLRSPLLCGKR